MAMVDIRGVGVEVDQRTMAVGVGVRRGGRNALGMRMVVMAVVVPVTMVVDQGLVGVFVLVPFEEEEVAPQGDKGYGH